MTTNKDDANAPTRSKDAPARSSAAKRTIRRRLNTRQARVLQAGKAGSPSSFITIVNPEATVAAYCGFNDIGQFRRFYTSPLVLPFYIKSLEYRGYRRRAVLFSL
jgi:hypothetical protein